MSRNQAHANGASDELESLCIRAASGDRPAFRKLVDRTHKTVYRLVFRILGSEADAEDVVQETFVRTWQRLHTLRDPSVVLSWICRVARNAAYDRLRKQTRHPADSLDRPVGEGLSPLVELLSSGNPDPEHQLVSAEVAGAVRAAMEKLKEKHRLILMLREVDGMSYEEIATALGCSVGTVESRLFRARKALSRRLKGLAREIGKEI